MEIYSQDEEEEAEKNEIRLNDLEDAENARLEAILIKDSEVILQFSRYTNKRKLT